MPYLYRAVVIRTQAIADMPWALYRVDGHAPAGGTKQRVDDAPHYANLTRDMQHRLMLTEGSLCLYGAAYWLKETNRGLDAM